MKTKAAGPLDLRNRKAAEIQSVRTGKLSGRRMIQRRNRLFRAVLPDSQCRIAKPVVGKHCSTGWLRPENHSKSGRPNHAVLESVRIQRAPSRDRTSEKQIGR